MAASSAAKAADEIEARELELKRREVALATKELEFKQASKPARPWSSPLVVALFAAAIAATGNAGVALINGQMQLNLEDLKAESARILQMLGTGDPDVAAENLQFLLDARLIANAARVQGITAYLATRVKGTGARIPATGPATTIIGAPGITIDETGQAVIDPQDPWYAENIVEVDIPQLAGVPLGMDDTGRPGTGKVKFHKIAAEALKAVFAEIEASGFAGDIKSFAGTLNPRVIRGSKTRISAHGLGLAIDLNVAWNLLGRAPAAEGQEGSVLRLVPIFEKHGFKWGGTPPSRDAGHFEFADFDALEALSQGS